MATETLKRVATTVVANTDTELGRPDIRTVWQFASLNVVNRGDSVRTFRIAYIDGAITDVAPEDYCPYDMKIGPHSVIPFTLGQNLEAEYTILVRADHADVHFIGWYSEIS
jgi:hypothetical protein